MIYNITRPNVGTTAKPDYSYLRIVDSDENQVFYMFPVGSSISATLLVSRDAYAGETDPETSVDPNYLVPEQDAEYLYQVTISAGQNLFSVVIGDGNEINVDGAPCADVGQFLLAISLIPPVVPQYTDPRSITLGPITGLPTGNLFELPDPIILLNSTPGGTWASTDDFVATVDPSDGTVTPMGTGECTISYTVSNDQGFTDTVTADIEVIDLIP